MCHNQQHTWCHRMEKNTSVFFKTRLLSQCRNPRQFRVALTVRLGFLDPKSRDKRRHCGFLFRHYQHHLVFDCWTSKSKTRVKPLIVHQVQRVTDLLHLKMFWMFDEFCTAVHNGVMKIHFCLFRIRFFPRDQNYKAKKI